MDKVQIYATGLSVLWLFLVRFYTSEEPRSAVFGILEMAIMLPLFGRVFGRR